MWRGWPATTITKRCDWDWDYTRGYIAYGFRDKGVKYGADLSIMLYKPRGITAYVAWQDDIAEAGVIPLRLESRPRGTELYRMLYRRRFDDIVRTDMGVRFRAMHHFQFDAFANKQLRTTNDNYRFVINSENAAVHLSRYEFSETGLSFRFAFRERYGMLMGERSLLSPSRWPLVFGEVAYGFGDIEYMRAAIRVQYRATGFLYGEPEFVLLVGQVWGDVPFSLLFSGRGTYRQYFISVRNTFETMGINEFLSSRFAGLFYSHTIHLKFSKNYRPDLVLRTSAAVGSLSNPRSHSGIEFKTLEKGYYESGLELNKLIPAGFAGIGVAAFWRYGPYSHEKTSDNLVLKFTLTLPL
jgi:hypothetical protein